MAGVAPWWWGNSTAKPSARLAGLHRLFQTFDPGAIATPNIWGYLWAKLIYGAMLFATALTDDSIADVLANERHPSGAHAIGP